MLPNPADIFSYLYNNHIGDSHALFWIAWAWAAERRKNFKFADKVYKKGMLR